MGKDDLLEFTSEHHDEFDNKENEVMTNDHYATTPNPDKIPADEIGDEVKTESPEASKKTSKKRLYISLAAVAVLVLGVSAFFILKATVFGTPDQPVDPTPLVDSSSLITNNQLSDSLSMDVDTLASTNTTEVVEKEDPNEKTTMIDEKKMVREVKDWGLARPCYIISFSGFADETKAQGDMKLLKGKGYKTGYYWIPDYLKNGNKFFKVYVGPFKSRGEARKRLAKIRKMSPKAYVLKVDLEK